MASGSPSGTLPARNLRASKVGVLDCLVFHKGSVSLLCTVFFLRIPLIWLQLIGNLVDCGTDTVIVREFDP